MPLKRATSVRAGASLVNVGAKNAPKKAPRARSAGAALAPRIAATAPPRKVSSPDDCLKGSITKAVSGSTSQFIIPQLTAEGEVTCVALTMEPPHGRSLVPVDMVCVVDISESMREVALKGEGGETESDRLTLLDLAKHALCTIICTLGPQDRLAVVLFNGRATRLFGLDMMGDKAKERAKRCIYSAEAKGGTNLWAGLNEACKILVERPRRQRGVGHVMLLTDGKTKDRDSVIPNMRAFLRRTTFPCTVNTFGLGCAIDSPLLEKISCLGHGTYSFIPDARFVGTVFVNTLSNLLCTCATEVLMCVDVEGCEIVAPVGMPCGGDYADLFRTRGGASATISIGSIQFDQPKTIVLVLAKSTPEAKVCFNVRYADQTGASCKSAPVKVDLTSLPDDAEARLQFYRASFVGLMNFVTSFDEVPPCSEAAAELAGVAVPTSQAPEEPHRLLAMKFVQLFCQSMEAYLSEGSAGDTEERLNELIVDTSGQVAEAVSSQDWWNKWGLHYLRSIMFAHRSQLCNNFKDISVQSYGGDLFKKMQEKADQIFNGIPPPQAPPGERPHVVDMSSYNQADCGCIDRTSEVQLADGSWCAIDNLVKGDRVVAAGGGSAEVICVVSTACEAGKAHLVHLTGGARVTAYHPVVVDGDWRFPCEIAPPQETACTSVCSIVLKGSPFLLVGSEEGQVACAALGHGIEEGAARHPYFGSNQVLQDLQRFPGFDSGRVDLHRNDILRDSKTGLVCRYRRA